MLRSTQLFRSCALKSSCLKCFCRLESTEATWEDIKSIKSNNWPILKGEATAEKTKLAKANYFRKRIVNTVPKTGWEVSCLGYGRGGSRVNNDDWSGELQRACRFGTNLIQLTISENYLDSNNNGNPSGFIPPHGMLHGLLTADNIDRGSMVISSKIYSHQRNGHAYSSQMLQKMIDMSINTMGVDCMDMITLEIPPFITESQLAMALYHMKSEIDSGRVHYLTIGGTFPFTAEGYNPTKGKSKKDKVDLSQFSFSFIKVMRMIKDVGLLDKLIGVEVPLNVSEGDFATRVLKQEQMKILNEYMNCSDDTPMTLLEVIKHCDLAIFVDRCFEGYQGERPVRLIDFKSIDSTQLLANMKEAFEICRYLEDVYRQKIRPSIMSLENHSSPIPDPDSFQFGYVLPTVMLQAKCHMIWEDLRHSAIEPNIRDGINLLAGISEDVKKWCFSYRLATTNMLNYISQAFKVKEIGYIDSKLDKVINELCPQYNTKPTRFYYKMLDSILALGVTSVMTDMIHIHAEDVNTPILTDQEAKKLLTDLKMPEDDVHLISMNDYEFKKEETSVKSMREKLSYLQDKEETTKEKSV